MRIVEWVRTKSNPRVILGIIVGTPFLAAMVIGTEALVRARLDDELFASPSQIYARPVVFYPGMGLDTDRVESHLERLGYRRVRRRTVDIGEYYRSSSKWIIGRRAFRRHHKLDPGGVVNIFVGGRGQIRLVEDAAGRRLPYIGLEPELIRSVYGSSGDERIPIPLTDIPKHVVDAVLSIEDQRFFDHGGLDLKRIVGATVANVRARRFAQGGSTLTQQLAKNLFLSPKRSPIRKLRDMAMATTLEQRHSKEEILETYLNMVYFGHDNGLAIYGVGRAAQHYFGKDASQLDVGEGALLAGIIKGPNLYHPVRRPETARERRNLVLNVMHDRGIISDRVHRESRRAPLGVRRRTRATRVGRYFTDFVTEQLIAAHGRKALETGLSVFTTMDMELQRAAEQAVRSGLERLESDHPNLKSGDAPLQAALVALDPRTGEVLAMVGGRDYGLSQFNRAAHAKRQPGSSFKPIVARSALVQRNGATLATVLQDEPLALETPAGLWEPANYDGQFRGEVTLREALERSLNVPFARLGIDVGPDRIVETARRLGLESKLNPVPSLALGSSEVTPLEMTRAFGVFAANGFLSQTQATLGVIDAQGEVLSRYQLKGKQAFSPAEAYLVTSALRGAVERGTGRSLRSRGYRGPVAAKSGTTNNFRDAWFIGYTPSLAVGVWVGFDDGRSIDLPGSRAALPIFASFLKSAHGPYGDGDFSMHSGVEIVEVNRETGLRAGYGCRGEREVFLRGTAPRERCSSYRSYTSRYRNSGSRRSSDSRGRRSSGSNRR
ncbi:MAG: PBP1A family penicillin-binding protein [Gemmatimonadetes bacterium]|nr:PBP1A family penicillin-binding protein [Gemmatimonadota bacterium]